MILTSVILKISGEALKDENNNVAPHKIKYIANLIKKVYDKKIRVGVIIGGGNFFRGRQNPQMEKVTGDTIGMLSTVINSLYLKDALREIGVSSIISTPFQFPNLIEDIQVNELKNITDRIVIFGGGIGKSGYSTDSAVVHASKICDSELIIKLTNVDGVYDSDPKKNSNAIKYDKISFDEVLDKKLEIMDLYAIKECKELNKQILVMDINDEEGLINFFNGKSVGTLIL